jgi:hypothetical protein
MDLPAKAKYMGFGGASAYYGCHYCTNSGERIRDHVYFPAGGANSTLRHGKSLKVGEMGVRSLPALYPLQKHIASFDCVRSMGIDAMHSVCSFFFFGVLANLSRSSWAFKRICSNTGSL